MVKKFPLSGIRRVSALLCVIALSILLAAPAIAINHSKDTKKAPRTTALPFEEYKLYPGVNAEKIIDPTIGTGSKGIVATLKVIVGTLRQLIGPVLVFFIGGMGIRLMIARGNEENFNAVAKNFLYVLAGVLILIFANTLSELFSLYQETGSGATTFVSGQGEIITATSKFKGVIQILIKFIRYLLGGLAVFYVVKSGVSIILNADEETVGKQKEVFLYGFVGFILIFISEALVNAVFDVKTLDATYGDSFVETNVNVSGGLKLIMNIANLLLGAMSGLFLFTLVVGGAMYAFSAGNEERGKKATNIIISSVVGLVISFSAYTIVAEFSAGGRALEEKIVPEDIEQVPLIPSQ